MNVKQLFCDYEEENYVLQMVEQRYKIVQGIDGILELLYRFWMICIWVFCYVIKNKFFICLRCYRQVCEKGS